METDSGETLHNDNVNIEEQQIEEMDTHEHEGEPTPPLPVDQTEHMHISSDVEFISADESAMTIGVDDEELVLPTTQPSSETQSEATTPTTLIGEDLSTASSLTVSATVTTNSPTSTPMTSPTKPSIIDTKLLSSITSLPQSPTPTTIADDDDASVGQQFPQLNILTKTLTAPPPTTVALKPSSIVVTSNTVATDCLTTTTTTTTTAAATELLTHDTVVSAADTVLPSPLELLNKNQNTTTTAVIGKGEVTNVTSTTDPLRSKLYTFNQAAAIKTLLTTSITTATETMTTTTTATPTAEMENQQQPEQQQPEQQQPEQQQPEQQQPEQQQPEQQQPEQQEPQQEQQPMSTSPIPINVTSTVTSQTLSPESSPPQNQFKKWSTTADAQKIDSKMETNYEQLQEYEEQKEDPLQQKTLTECMGELRSNSPTIVTSTTVPIIFDDDNCNLNEHIMPERITASIDPSSIIMPDMMPVVPPVEPSPDIPINTNEDQPMDEEETRSEATFSFRIEEFSKLKESLLSPPCFVRNLPWKIMVMPRTNAPNERNQMESRSLGFFLQCNGESDSTTWSCNAIAELRLLSFKPDQDAFVRRIKHVFYSKENDWGFSHFMPWVDILDPVKQYIQNDVIILEVYVQAEAPHGVLWDSKKHTGYVGLKNQGATCYMNSLLQTLFFTNQFRKAVYKMPTEADDSTKSVALALQRVFNDLQYSDKPVGTKKLTKSFGWETLDSFMQHDVQEFLRVLLDKVESKMKQTCVEGTVPNLFEGQMSSYIKCKNVEYTSTNVERYYDIQLNIKGKKNIDESFKDYCAKETLDGDNKYDAGEHGLQDAEKGVIFVSFPPVLHLHLMRFQYDPITDNSVKFNDRFEFYEHIQLDQYLQKKGSKPAGYTLHAVLVHSGDNHGGHYVVYINPLGDGRWCKFDDDVVSRCSKSDAIDNNFGGVDDDMSLNTRHCSNAYMLAYIRDAAMAEVLSDIKEYEIPTELVDRLTEERRMEQVRRRERAEAPSYMVVNVLLEEYFEFHQTTDLFDLEKAHYRPFKMKKNQTVGELMQAFVTAFNVRMGRMRMWQLIHPQSSIARPILFDHKENFGRNLIHCAELQNPWTIFLQLQSPEIAGDLPPFNRDTDILLFFKEYDPEQKKLHYSGLGTYKMATKISDIIPELNRSCFYPIDTDLTVYEEQSSNVILKIHDHSDTLHKALKIMRVLMDCAIVIFEKSQCDGEETSELPTCEDYIRELVYRVTVTFCDKNIPTDPGIQLELSQRMTYDQIATAVGSKINVDPYNIQFFKCQNYKDLPGNALRCSYEGSLKDLLLSSKSKNQKKIFYQQLSMNINELENKKQFKCIYLSPNMKDEKELILYPNKNGTVKNLLEEAAKQIVFSEESTHRLRIVEIQNYKVNVGPREDTPLETLQSNSDLMGAGAAAAAAAAAGAGAVGGGAVGGGGMVGGGMVGGAAPVTGATGGVGGVGAPAAVGGLAGGAPALANQKMFRIEEIPADELTLLEDEMLIPVAHYHKDIYNSFGIPFFIKAQQGEQFVVLKDRIQKKLNISNKEFEKYKFAVVTMGRAEYISDEKAAISLVDFKYSTPGMQRPYLALEHLNRTQKRSRYNYVEKAIKIYN